MDSNQTCPYCHFTLITASYFCPNCGKPLNQKPLSTTILREITVYLISFFLPPFGLWHAFKYLRQNGEKTKRIGILAILLTVVSLILTFLLASSLINSFNKLFQQQTDFQELL